MKNFAKGNRDKVVVFDFDGMLFNAPEMFSEKLTHEFGIPFEKMKPFFTSDLQKCQKGLLDMKEVLKGYLPKWGWEKGGAEMFLTLWFEYGEMDNELLEYAKKLREKAICVLVTNNERYRIEYMTQKYDLDSALDYIVRPYELGAIKPEREIYEHVIEKTGVEPGKIIFFDDYQQSIDVANSLGMKGRLYVDKDGLESDVENFLMQ